MQVHDAFKARGRAAIGAAPGAILGDGGRRAQQNDEAEKLVDSMILKGREEGRKRLKKGRIAATR